MLKLGGEMTWSGQSQLCWKSVVLFCWRLCHCASQVLKHTEHQTLLQQCSQSRRISGHSCKRRDASSGTCLSRLSVSKRVTSAANICLARHAEESRCLKTPRAVESTIICAGGGTALCSFQQMNKRIIAAGLLAHHSLKAVAPASKMHVLPQGSTNNPNRTTVTNIMTEPGGETVRPWHELHDQSV